MRAPYCLPIIKQPQSEVLEVIKTNLADYQFFEVWLDYVESVDQAFIDRLVELLGDRLVVVFRRENLEPIVMPIEQRQRMLNMLSNTPALVDLDIDSQRVELDYIREHNLGITKIVSWHDYQQTPDTVRLEAIIATMEPYQPAIYKLATFCTGSADGLRLMRLLLKLKSEGRTTIVLGMGQDGLVTRVFGSLWGNAMTFAPLVASEQSAPGQLTRDQLETIFKELEQ